MPVIIVRHVELRTEDGAILIALLPKPEHIEIEMKVSHVMQCSWEEFKQLFQAAELIGDDQRAKSKE